MRIDQLLVQRGLAATRSQAQRLIACGVLWCPSAEGAFVWQRVAKNGEDVPADARVHIVDASETKYVSRAGLKLEVALQWMGVPLQGLCCLDVGQSTGGFTDCLLQHGADCVVGVEVGSAQLHPRLRQDPRVICLEQTNARYLTAPDLAAALQTRAHSVDPATKHCVDALQTALAHDVPAFDVLVMDVSFISQTLVLPAVLPLVKNTGFVFTLVKPQFELQAAQVGKGGVVKDAALYAVVEQRLRHAYAALGLRIVHWCNSPIEGGDGNREFLLCAKRTPTPCAPQAFVRDVSHSTAPPPQSVQEETHSIDRE